MLACTEPVAAVIAYGLGRDTEDSLILVIDLGGGTYDVSLVECFEGDAFTVQTVVLATCIRMQTPNWK